MYWAPHIHGPVGMKEQRMHGNELAQPGALDLSVRQCNGLRGVCDADGSARQPTPRTESAVSGRMVYEA